MGCANYLIGGDSRARNYERRIMRPSLLTKEREGPCTCSGGESRVAISTACYELSRIGRYAKELSFDFL